MFAIAAFVILAIALVIDVTHASIDFPFVTLGLLLLAAHFAFGPWTPWGRRP